MFPLNMPALINHRGASAQAPENTLAAVKRAAELGAQWIEFDVCLTRDGVPVVIHDNSVNRTTNGRGKVARLPYHEIAKLDAGSWFSDAFANERVPTLAQWLLACAQNQLGFNLEMKSVGNQADQLACVVAEHLEQYWPKARPTPLLSSASKLCLRAIKRVAPQYPRGYISDFWRPGWRSILDELDCATYNLYFKSLTPKRVEKIHATGRKVLAFTVLEKSVAQYLLEIGVDALFVNDVTLLQPTGSI